MNKGAEHINFEGRDVYERMIDVFFYFKPIKDLKKTVHPEFMGYGTAAHEFFSNRLDVTAMAKSQSEQLRHQKVEIQRKPIVERVFANGTSCLIIEEFDMNFKDTNHHLLARLSTILECIDGKWIVTHFHGSTPDSNIAEDEAFPKEGLVKKNEELEAKIKARTRDLEIEAALEKVRSRSIGMQKSEELREVIQVIHDQLILLNFQIDAAGFTLDYHQNNDWNVWIANKSGSLPSLMFIPYIDHPQFNYYKHAKEEGLDFLANMLNFEDKNSIFNYMFRFMGDYPQAEKDEVLSKPGLAISQAFLKNISLWAYNLDAIPYSEEENKTLMRFAKVFEQTYVRFNDL
ncbi:MAG: SnoaL-like domain-containing protein, partial [Eudoraea sp.]|nr:SnoaL-like domain-containing protein [Eudoraea sp.]